MRLNSAHKGSNTKIVPHVAKLHVSTKEKKRPRGYPAILYCCANVFMSGPPGKSFHRPYSRFLSAACMLLSLHFFLLCVELVAFVTTSVASCYNDPPVWHLYKQYVTHTNMAFTANMSKLSKGFFRVLLV